MKIQTGHEMKILQYDIQNRSESKPQVWLVRLTDQTSIITGMYIILSVRFFNNTFFSIWKQSST